jgi:hypothetical protein
LQARSGTPQNPSFAPGFQCFQQFRGICFSLEVSPEGPITWGFGTVLVQLVQLLGPRKGRNNLAPICVVRIWIINHLQSRFSLRSEKVRFSEVPFPELPFFVLLALLEPGNMFRDDKTHVGVPAAIEQSLTAGNLGK